LYLPVLSGLGSWIFSLIAWASNGILPDRKTLGEQLYRSGVGRLWSGCQRIEMTGEPKFVIRRHNVLIQQNAPNMSTSRVLERTCALIPPHSRQDHREIKHGRRKYGSAVDNSKGVGIKGYSDTPSATTSSWHSYEVRIGDRSSVLTAKPRKGS